MSLWLQGRTVEVHKEGTVSTLLKPKKTNVTQYGFVDLRDTCLLTGANVSLQENNGKWSVSFGTSLWTPRDHRCPICHFRVPKGAQECLHVAKWTFGSISQKCPLGWGTLGLRVPFRTGLILIKLTKILVYKGLCVFFSFVYWFPEVGSCSFWTPMKYTGR